MVHFGDSLREASRPEWGVAYLDYDRLKRHLKEMKELSTRTESQNNAAGLQREEELSLLVLPAADQDVRVVRAEDIVRCARSFFRDLNNEIEKVSLFTMRKEGELADAIGYLRFGASSSDRHPHRAPFSRPEDSSSSLLLQGMTSISSDVRDQISYLGVELLHLLRYICINATGIRKIIKKYRKLVFAAVRHVDSDEQEFVMDELLLQGTASRSPLPFSSSNIPEEINVKGISHDSYMQLLANSTSIEAIHTSLVMMALADVQLTLQDDSARSLPSMVEKSDVSQFRLQFVLTSIQTLRASANVVNSPFDNYLSRKAMIRTGTNLGDLEGSFLSALEILLKFEPDSIFRLSENDLMRWQELMGTGGVQLDALRKSRHARTMSSMYMEDGTESVVSVEDLMKDKGGKEWGGVGRVSLVINFISTLLYTINYYIVAPNANHYSVLLGHDGAYGATLIGASSFAALFAAFLYSLWYTKSTFKSALMFSSIMPLIGNLLYGMAISYNSLGMALFGRILCGFGSAEVVNRQLISACVSYERMTRASALFVGAGASGMSLGPLLGSLFDLVAGRDSDVDLLLPFTPKRGIIFNHLTGPAFFMSALWFIQLLCLIFFFEEPDRLNASASQKESDRETSWSFQLDKRGSDVSMLTPYGSETIVPLISAHETIDLYKRDASSEENTDRSTLAFLMDEVRLTFSLAFGKPALPITLVVFCYIEMADEVLISSCSMVCRRYFGWHGAVAGFLIASLGSLVLPADYVVERASHVLSERRIMKYSIIFIIVGLLMICNYEGLLYDLLGGTVEVIEDVQKDKDVMIGSIRIVDLLNSESEFPYDWTLGPYVYVIFLSAIFMGTIILEGVDTSLMAKLTPARLNDSVFNSGLLATLIGTLGRVFADLLITMSALLDVYTFVDFCNATFMPLLLIAVVLYLLLRNYYSDFLISLE